MLTTAKRRLNRLLMETRDLLELVCLPGLAAILPWSLCFRVFKRMARWQWLYRDACENARTHARQRGWVHDEARWLATRRLITLVDHADFYLARTRSNKWLTKNLLVEGQWPQPDTAAVLCTFHWGVGMWALRHAGAHHLKAHALVAPLVGAHFAGRAVLHRYAKARTASVADALGCQTLDVSNSLRPALRALRAHEQVVAAIDVPSDQVSSSQAIELLGMKAHVPRALLRLAVDHELPITVFLTGIRIEDGQRFLRLHTLGVWKDIDALIPEVYKILEGAIRENPPAWHFWGESERFFARTDSA